MNHGKMLGRIHDPQCDCNAEWAVAGSFEKCNYRYGVKRQRSREKRELEKHIRDVRTNNELRT